MAAKKKKPKADNNIPTVEPLSVPPGAVLVLRGNWPDTAVRLLAEGLGKAGRNDVLVVKVAPDQRVEALDTAEMRKHGWVRARGKPRAKR